jgi:hypothetical protein
MNLKPTQPVQPPKLTLVGNTTVKLSKQIQGHNGPVDEITLREPLLGDWIECGEFHKTAVHVDEQGNRSMSVAVDAKAVANWFVRLSGLPAAVLMQMPHRDGLKVFAELQRIAGDIGGEGNSPTPPATFG